jgi:nitroreductase
MEIPHKEWIRAIQERTSRRAFEKRNLAAADLEKLKSFVQAFTFYDGARVALKEEGAEQVLKGIVGSYGGVANARAYIALVVDPANKHAQERAGYLGEAFVLQATRLGLGTCWIGGSFDPAKAGQAVGVSAGERVVAVVPVGYPLETQLMREKIIKAAAGSHRRKETKDLVAGVPEEKWTKWAANAVEAARLAPSAVNRQPWRFEVDAKGITVSFSGAEMEHNISKRLDCGIAMLHVEVGARAAGMSGSWEFLESPKVARFKAVV